MEALVLQRCLHHPAREAVARCPECTQFYCRECITEHDDRVICTDCLRKLSQVAEVKPSRLAGLPRLFFSLLGFVAAWILFYQLGRVLLLIPPAFHEGTVWQSTEL